MENAKTIQYTVKQICDILGVPMPAEYAHIANDTLSFLANNPALVIEDSAFFLFSANTERRAKKLARALPRKPKVVFCGPACRGLPSLQKIPHIFVPNARDALERVSAQIRQDLGCKVVGVTGSLGKTTTKEMIHSVLKQQYNTDKSPGNSNTVFLIIRNMQRIPNDTQVLVQEFGAGIREAPMERNAKVCMPDVTVITNISDPHLDIFGSREGILAEKLKLVKATPKGNPVFLNYDDALLKTVSLEDHPVISFAVENREADYCCDNVQIYEEYMTFDIVHNGRHTPVTLHSHGAYNIANALAAAAIGEWFGLSQEQIAAGIDAFRSEGIRQSLTNIGGYQLYIDCYNTAPISLVGAVDVLSKLPIEEGGKRIAVMGDIVRLGDQAEALHREVSEKIGSSGKLDLALCFGNEYAKLMAQTIRANGTAALYTSDRNVLNKWLRGLITKKDIALFKGPVARLLSKSIDQVYGTSYHIDSEHFDRVVRNGFRVTIIFEKEDFTLKLAALTKYDGADAVVSTPTVVNGAPVFSVASNCFAKNGKLRQVTIAEGTTNIGSSAFEACTGLNQINIPSSMLGIEDRAFSGCTVLTQLQIPEGVIHLGEEVFAGCTKLEKVGIPASVGYIGEEAFRDCEKVTILCREGSYAHSYAVEKQIPCQII